MVPIRNAHLRISPRAHPVSLPLQKAAVEEFRPLQLLVEEAGDLGLTAVRNLAAAHARRRQRLTLSQLRVLRPLITVEARQKLMPHLLPKDGVLDLKQLDREAARLVKDLWVDFHWSEENPKISPDVRMLLPDLHRPSAPALPCHTPLCIPAA